jgi:hypothetical protein
MEKIPYDEDVDKLLWMRHNLSFNIALTTEGFRDEDLPHFFGEEPVWIVADHVGYHLIFRMLGLESFKAKIQDEIPEGFDTLTLKYGIDNITFHTYKPRLSEQEAAQREK